MRDDVVSALARLCPYDRACVEGELRASGRLVGKLLASHSDVYRENTRLRIMLHGAQMAVGIFAEGLEVDREMCGSLHRRIKRAIARGAARGAVDE